MSPLLLIVDDDAATRDLLAEVLADEGYRVRTTDRHALALPIILDEVPTILIDCTETPVWSIDLAGPHALRDAAPGIPVIVVSARHRLGTIDVAADRIFATLPKPFDLEDFLELVRRAIAGSSPSVHPRPLPIMPKLPRAVDTTSCPRRRSLAWRTSPCKTTGAPLESSSSRRSASARPSSSTGKPGAAEPRATARPLS